MGGKEPDRHLATLPELRGRIILFGPHATGTTRPGSGIGPAINGPRVKAVEVVDPYRIRGAVFAKGSRLIRTIFSSPMARA